MKNIKAVIMIIVGSFFIATAFAFAGDSAFNTLKSGGFDKSASDDLSLSSARGAAPAVSAPAAVEDSASAGAAASGTTATAEKKPSFGKKLLTKLSNNKTNLFAGAIGAYIGFALVGTLLGACTFGVGTVLLLTLAAL